jgi:hypothetical protein
MVATAGKVAGRKAFKAMAVFAFLVYGVSLSHSWYLSSNFSPKTLPSRGIVIGADVLQVI